MPPNQKQGPTPEENRILILDLKEQFVDAIKDLELSQTRLLTDLKESEQKSAKRSQWLFGIFAGLTTFVVGTIGIPLLVFVANMNTSVAVLQTKITITDKLDRRLDELDKRVSIVESKK